MTRYKYLTVLLPICIIANACTGVSTGTGANKNVTNRNTTINPYITEINGGFLTASADKTLYAAEPAEPRAGAKQFVLSEFSTEFNAKDAARRTNIELAAAAIDGQMLNPGEEFSFNETLGPTTKANGYKFARIFIKGKKTNGYGGGVCQVSSTLYNAADDAGLEITERHAHSLPVAYVPEGD